MDVPQPDALEFFLDLGRGLHLALIGDDNPLAGAAVWVEGAIDCDNLGEIP